MRTTRALATCAVLVLAALAGCLGDATAPAPPVDPPVEDPQAAASPETREEPAPAAPSPPLSDPVRILVDPPGDATEHNSDRAAQAMTEACKLIPRSERGACNDAIPQDRVGGTPAPPALDLLSVSVQQSASQLAWIVELATLTGDPSDFVDGTGRYGTSIGIDWTAGTACTGYVEFRAVLVPDAIQLVARSVRTHDNCDPPPGDPLQGRCATVQVCGLPIDWTIEPGSPGFLRMSVPRAETALLEAGMEVRAKAVVERDGISGFPYGWMQPGSDLGTSQVNFDGRLHGYVVDDTETGAFLLTGAGDPASRGRAASAVEVRPWAGAVADPNLDILRVGIDDDPKNFTHTVTVRELPASPVDLDFLWQFTSPAKHHYILVGTGDGGDWRMTRAVRWLGENQIPIATNLSVEPGVPGRITIRIPRSELPGTTAGDATRLMIGGLAKGLVVSGSDGPAGYYYHYAQYGDSLSLILPPYAFKTDAAAGVSRPAIEALDRVEDVIAPQGATADPAFRPGRFDLAYADVRVDAAARIHLKLGVARLDEVVVPRLYDAALFGAGFQTDRGPVMIALRQDRNAQPVAFCAPDTAFLLAEPRDPGTQAGAPIAWSIRPSSGDASGLIAFEASPACFGLRDGERDLSIQRMTARSALIGNPVGSAGGSPFHVLDDLDEPDGGRLVFPATAVAPSPWARPFGIENFWDILGIVLALAFATTSALVIVRKRLRMRAYLIELEDLADARDGDADGYAEALVRLRRRLFADLLANRLSEGHFVMIEERLRSALSGTRINAFGRAFYHLPPALMIRLQSLLSDGRFSREDHRILNELIRELAIDPGEREAVARQVARWADQDHVVGQMTRALRARRGAGRLTRHLRRGRSRSDEAVPDQD